MTERAAPTEPPLVICDGRFVLFADGEIQMFLRDGKSWTTGTLDGRDLAALRQYLPAVVDNVTDVYGKEVV